MIGMPRKRKMGRRIVFDEANQQEKLWIKELTWFIALNGVTISAGPRPWSDARLEKAIHNEKLDSEAIH